LKRTARVQVQTTK